MLHLEILLLLIRERGGLRSFEYIRNLYEINNVAYKTVSTETVRLFYFFLRLHTYCVEESARLHTCTNSKSIFLVVTIEFIKNRVIL